MIYPNLLSAIKRYNFIFFGLSSLIFFVGVFNLYSATHSLGSSYLSNLYKSQIIWYLLSLGIGFGLSFINPKNYYLFSNILYALITLFLLLVLFVGIEGMGAKRWLDLGFFRIQPSELSKIAIILFVARWYTRIKYKEEIGLKDVFFPFALIFIPTVLIIIQPDLGTGVIILAMFFLMSFYRGLKPTSILIVAVVGLLCGWGMYKYVLKDYQRKRLSTFLNPESDIRGAGYNAIQSKIAIGSGRFWGKGFMKSTQASLNYLPENHTDFIFSIFSEERGFVGGLFLLALYLALLWKYFKLAISADQLFDSLVVMGMASLFFLHIVVNIGMVTGLLPIVGLPLPLVSYGGSSLLTFFICNGIATSISNSQKIF